MKKLSALLALCLMMLLPQASFGAYPEKPITMLVPYSAGGNVDMIARGLAPALEELLGTKILVSPTPGAGGAIAIGKLLKEKADGYTLLIGNNTSFTMRPFMQKVRYSDKDVVPVCGVALPIHILGANKDGDFSSLDEMVAFAKKNPGAVSIAQLGRAGLHEIMVLMMMRELGIELKQVPFNSGPEQVSALRGKHVQLLVTDNYNPEILPLASFNNECKAIYPNTKSFAEQGKPELGRLLNVYSIFAPAGTPAEVIKTFRDAVRKAVTSEQFQTVAKNLRIPAQFMEAEELASVMASDMKIMKELGDAGAYKAVK